MIGVLDRLVERIYLLRCQLVHGAATYNSSLNRTAIRHCSLMTDHLLRAILLVWINPGAEDDWGIMCYPPLRLKAVVGLPDRLNCSMNSVGTRRP
jgi:hypothetical protein